MSTNTGLAAAAKAILDAHDAPNGPSKADTIKALAALIGEPPADPVREQLVAAVKTAQMCILGYTSRNLVINKALADCSAALTAASAA